MLPTAACPRFDIQVITARSRGSNRLEYSSVGSAGRYSLHDGCKQRARKDLGALSLQLSREESL